ncbi:MAG: RidA family protein [Bacteroidetes bacterium]|nr:RidA family protein [Fibrella sp.]
METRVINPWKWQDQRGYAQAIDVKQATSTLYCSGQTAIDAEGNASKADMRSQLIQSLENLERVIREAGYEMKHIVRLNIYTTATDELYPCFDVLMAWQAKYGLKQATTLLEVKSLFETCKVELEATAVK